MRLGSHQTEESKAKNSMAHLGRTMSPSARAKISAANAGKSLSPETRARISMAQMGNGNCLGQHCSDETKAKISAANSNPSAETRAKISLARWKGGKQINNAKMHAKRRILGFTSLNSWFKGCEGHHVDNELVIFIPRELHCSISHNQWTGRNMAVINSLAFEWLAKEEQCQL